MTEVCLGDVAVVEQTGECRCDPNEWSFVDRFAIREVWIILSDDDRRS